MENFKLSPVSQFYEMLAASKLTPAHINLEISYDQTCDGVHTCVVTCELFGQKYLGQGAEVLKRTAKMHAFEDLLSVTGLPLRERAQEVRETISPIAADLLAKPFMYECIKQHLRVAHAVSRFERRPVVVIDDSLPLDAEAIAMRDPSTDRMLNFHRVIRNGQVITYCLSGTVQSLERQLKFRAVDVYLAQPCTSRGDSDLKVLLDAEIVPNASNPRETPIEPVAQVGVMDNPGTNTVPHLPNPQPTAVTPAAAAQDPSLVAALEPLAPHETLNPLGPPNMLGTGGITFDIKDLIYSQYIDCDQQYQYTDDTTQGAVIFQIPYDPTGPLVNPYIRQWVSMHPRYTGALNFRFTVVGNSTFSGLIGFAWYPHAVESNTVKVSEMMKYSYTTMGVNQPSNRIFTLFDARQTQFWRDTSDDPKANPRPVLIAFVYMTAVSPLKEGITIRIRVASKLSDGSDGPAFLASNPTLPLTNPGNGVPAPTGLDVNYTNALVGLPVVPILARPLTTFRPLYICLDGDTYADLTLSRVLGDSGLEGYPYLSGNPATYPALYSVTDISADWNIQSGIGGKPTIGVGLLDLTHYTGVGGLSNKTFNYLQQHATDGEPIEWQFNNVGDDFVADKSVKVYQILKLGDFDIGDANVVLGPRAEAGEHYSINSDKSMIDIIMTSGGPIICYQYMMNVPSTSTTDRYVYSRIPTMTAFKSAPSKIERYSVAADWRPEIMPSGWRALKISCDAPFLVGPGITCPTLYNHPSVQNIFKNLAISTTVTQCIHFTLSDMDSGTDLVYGRFYKDRNEAIVNLGPSELNSLYYATLKRPSHRLYLSALGVIERNNSFPITLADHFLSNIPAGAMYRRLHPYDPREDGIIHPNAFLAPALMAAGEGAKGIGGAIGSVGNYFASKEQREWQGEQNQANRDLMSSQGDAQRELQRWLAEYSGGNMFKYQENQNSFLSALSAQNSNQWLANQKDLSAFNYEMQGYMLPSTQRGLNRAGLGFYNQSNLVSGIRRNNGTQASPEQTSSSTQVSSPPGADVTTQGTQTGEARNPQVKLRRSNAFRSYDRSNAQSFGALPQRRIALTTAGSSDV